MSFTIERNGFERLDTRAIWRDEAGVLYVSTAEQPAGMNELEQIRDIADRSSLILSSKGVVLKNDWGPVPALKTYQFTFPGSDVRWSTMALSEDTARQFFLGIWGEGGAASFPTGSVFASGHVSEKVL
jgi:hypothetical protein